MHTEWQYCSSPGRGDSGGGTALGAMAAAYDLAAIRKQLVNEKKWSMVVVRDVQLYAASPQPDTAGAVESRRVPEDVPVRRGTREHVNLGWGGIQRRERSGQGSHCKQPVVPLHGNSSAVTEVAMCIRMFVSGATLRRR